MDWFLEQLNRVGNWWKARQQRQALNDLQRGQDILRQMEADGATIVERAKSAEVSPHDGAKPPSPPPIPVEKPE